MLINMKKWLLIIVPLLIVFGASPTEAGGRHGYYGHYSHHGYGHHGGHHGYDAGYLVGGLVLGSLLTHAYHRNTYDYYDYPRYRRSAAYPVYRETAVIPGRRLYKDIDGNCFERVIDDGGNELLTELPAADCDW